MNNGAFVRLPVATVHVFHNQPGTIAASVCTVRVSLLTVMLSSLMLELGPRCLQSAWWFLAGWSF